MHLGELTVDPASRDVRLKDRFYQADPAQEGGEKQGAGLGLTIWFFRLCREKRPDLGCVRTHAPQIRVFTTEISKEPTIVHQIMQSHGGRISVRSKGAGTTFDVFLPLAQSSAITLVKHR